MKRTTTRMFHGGPLTVTSSAINVRRPNSRLTCSNHATIASLPRRSPANGVSPMNSSTPSLAKARANPAKSPRFCFA